MMAQATAELTEFFVIDSGASDHMTTKLEYSIDPNEIQPRLVVLGSGSTVTASHSGKVRIALIKSEGRTNKVQTVMFHDVRCVPQLKVNLLSVTALCRERFEVKFNAKFCTIS